MKTSNLKALTLTLAALFLIGCDSGAGNSNGTNVNNSTRVPPGLGGARPPVPDVITEFTADCPPPGVLHASLDGRDIPSMLFNMAAPRTVSATDVRTLLGPLQSDVYHRLVITCDGNATQRDILPAYLGIREVASATGPWAAGSPRSGSGPGGGSRAIGGPPTVRVGGTMTLSVFSAALPQPADISVTVDNSANISVSPKPLPILHGTFGAALTITGLAPGTFWVSVTAPGFELAGPGEFSGTVVP